MLKTIWPRWYLAFVLGPMLIMSISSSVSARLMEIDGLMERSDTICKVKVRETVEDGVITDDQVSPIRTIERLITDADVLACIRGEPGIRIKFAYPKIQMRDISGPGPYISFTDGEVCIVFLKKNGPTYELADYRGSKIDMPANTSVYSMGKKWQDRLLAELMSSARTGEGVLKFDAIDQLWRMQDQRSVSLLRDLSGSTDIVVKALALEARVRLWDAPATEDVLSVLRLKNETLDYSASRKKYQTSAYEMVNLKFYVVNSLEESVRGGDWGTGVQVSPSNEASLPPAKLKNFDYLDFINKALQIEAIRKSDSMRILLASMLPKLHDRKSVPLAVELLDDTSADVRVYAAHALAAIDNKPELYVSDSRFKQDEEAYIAHWKDWWKQHAAEFSVESPSP